MDKIITINGKTYIGRLTYAGWSRIEMMGVSISDIGSKQISFIGAILAAIMKVDFDEACAEIDKFMENGGDFEKLAEDLGEVATESGFFRALNKDNEEEVEETPETEQEESTTKTVEKNS